MDTSGDFLTQYLAYTDETECPVIYSRWAAIVGIGALLGRNAHIQHGHFNIYPNIYGMLVGTAGARKSTSINIFKKLARDAGYYKFSPNKVKAETFLKLLSDDTPDAASAEDFLWQDVSVGDAAEIFVTADEFNNFIGVGNLDFMSILGELWDFNGEYKNPLATKKSVFINNPTVSILAGNTPTGFHVAFPPEALGQGFFSRLLLIHGEPRDRKYAFPKRPAQDFTSAIVDRLKTIRETKFGNIGLSKGAESLLERIYSKSTGVHDVRFDSYNTRRFSHLLKLCIVIYVADAKRTSTIEEKHVRYANTILTHAEQYMPKALGEFGRAKNSDVGHKIVQLLQNSAELLELRDIWKHVAQDLEKLSQLVEILQNLATADKIQMLPGKGFLAKRKVLQESVSEALDFDVLTTEEREMPL